MSLRNKLTILSITLMSLMTIPTLAENDNQPVNSRIESANFDVQINTPEGWSETKDFTSIPETFTINGQTFRGLQFKNGSELHGCAIFFSENVEDDEDNDDDVDLFKTLSKVQELAFPGSNLSKFTISKVTFDGSVAADINAETAKVILKGTVEGSVSQETGDPTQLTISGSIKADTKDNLVCVLGTGTVVAEGAMPISGTTCVLSGDNYDLIFLVWGADEESQVRDTYRFIEAMTIKEKVPAETDTVVISETVTGDAVVVTESVERLNSHRGKGSLLCPLVHSNKKQLLLQETSTSLFPRQEGLFSVPCGPMPALMNLKQADRQSLSLDRFGKERIFHCLALLAARV